MATQRLVFKDLVQTSRPLLWLNTAVLAALATIMLNRFLDQTTLVLIIYFTLPFNLYLHGINDVYDYESDRLNERKGSDEGALLPRRLHLAMLRWVAILNVPFVIILLLISPLPAGVLLGVFLFLGWAYSAPPIRGKSRPFLDSLINAAYILPFLIGLAQEGLAVSEWPWRGILAFCTWSIASHAFTSIQDIEADRKAGIHTVATFLGATGSAVFALALYLAAAWLASGYGLLWGLLLLLYPVLVVWFMNRPSRAVANWLYRIFIFSNSALGFIVTTTLALANPQTTLWAAVVVLTLVAVVVAAVRWSRGGRQWASD